MQLATARGTKVVGVASAGRLARLRLLGARPVAHGDGLMARVRASVPGGVGRSLDAAGNGVLTDLVELVGGAAHIAAIADSAGARAQGVRFSRGEDGRALYILPQVAATAARGRLVPPAVHTFTLDDVREAHRVGEAGHATGKLILVEREPAMPG